MQSKNAFSKIFERDRLRRCASQPAHNLPLDSMERVTDKRTARMGNSFAHAEKEEIVMRE